ncbi:MAG: LysM peptidoglycan-binding domain-containing protein [Steroidobacteraceae bacterium]
MSLNYEFRSLRVAQTAGVIVAAAALAGCSLFGGRSSTDVSAAVPVAAQTDTAPTTAEPDLTATEAAIAGLNDSAQPMPASESPIRPGAPMSYTVKRGDTLWDISSLFLRDPWLWPEIWQINPQVENPHLIYPGDVLSLAYGTDGRPVISLSQAGAARMSPRLRSSDLDGPIATIPYSAIAAFLARPSVVSAEDLKTAPHVLAFRDGHMVGGSDHEIYVRDLAGPARARYNVVHVGDPLRDPETGDVVGYMGTYAATAVITKAGNPAKAMLTDTARETLQGDRLIANDLTPPMNFAPRSPSRPVKGQIISVVDGVELIGQYQIVVINRGARDGIETGNVLAVDQAGEVVRDNFGKRSFFGIKTGSAFAPKVKLPNERSGTMLVFRVYDRMSFGLIVSAENAIRVADHIRNP